MTDQKEQAQAQAQQPQGQAYGKPQQAPKEKPKEDKPKKVRMTAGTPPRPMTPNEILHSGAAPEEQADDEKADEKDKDK